MEKEEGGYLSMEQDSKGVNKTNHKFGFIKRTDTPGDGNEAYKLESKIEFEGKEGEGFTDEDTNPWVARDNIWIHGEYDGHITGTMCRKYKIAGNDNKLKYMGNDWQNAMEVRIWYTQQLDTS